MTVAKHTPGPWAIHADGVKVGNVGDFQPFSACGCCGSPWISGDSEEEKIANSRLMVAAPDLLAALKAMTEAYEGNVPDHCNADWFEEYRNAQAAIAKATGT